MERTYEAPSNEAPHMILGYHQGRLVTYLQFEFSGIAWGQAKNPKDEHDTFARLSQSELHVVSHQNLPQSKDVENIFVTFCLHDRRQHRRRHYLFIYWLIFAETSPMIVLLVYLFFVMSILNPMTILKYFYYS